MDTLAAVFREIRQPLAIERITLDPPGPTEVLVRLAAVGLCRTDYHVIRGERRVAMRPMVLGHEAAGIVEQIGTAVEGIKPYDHVVLTFIRPAESAAGAVQAYIISALRVPESLMDHSLTAHTAGVIASALPLAPFA